MKNYPIKNSVVQWLHYLPAIFTRLYQTCIIVMLIELSGCGILRKARQANDYAFEKFLRNKWGALCLAACGFIGVLLAFTTNNSRNSVEMKKRRLWGFVLIAIAVWIGFMRAYFLFYYQGRKVPYEF